MAVNFQIFITIHSEDVVIACFRNGVVSRCAEIVYPVEVVDIRSIGAGDFNRAVGGAGIHNNNFPIEMGKAASFFAIMQIETGSITSIS